MNHEQGQVGASGRIDPSTAAARIDLDAFVANIDAIRSHVSAKVMVVLKADAYGHGLQPCRRAARAAGVEWIGVAGVGEANACREAGDQGRLFAWMYGEDEDLTVPVAHDIDLGVHRVEQLSRVVAAAGTCERTARVHLKIDTGLSRNGAPPALWAELCAEAAAAEQAGTVEVVGLWSHFISSDDLSLPWTADQLEQFELALSVAEAAGLKPSLRHIANSAAALQVPAAHYDLVRLGIAAYGVDPGEGVAAGAGVVLRPVMTLRTQLLNVKPISSDSVVSYGAAWRAEEDTVVGLVPLGYADGVPRHASNVARVQVNGRSVPIRGRVCMDQFVVELGAGATDLPGDEVVIFGAGGPAAEELAEACGTIGYEIVTRIGTRVPRVYHSADTQPVEAQTVETQTVETQSRDAQEDR